MSAGSWRSGPNREIRPGEYCPRFSAIFGLRDGITTLWLAAAIFGALLIWAAYKLIGPAAIEGPGGIERTAAIAIQLLAPPVATAWAIRDESEIQARMVLGARALLLLTAALSTVVALALSGVTPFDWSMPTASGVYASLAYGAVVILAIGWTVSQPFTWAIYRNILTNRLRNVAVIAVATLFGVVAVVHDALDDRLTGAVLVICGLSLAAVAVNPLWTRMEVPGGALTRRSLVRNGEPAEAGESSSRDSLSRSGRPPRVAIRFLAASTAFANFVAAGSFLGFNDGSPEARFICLATLAFSAVLAPVIFLVTEFRQQRKIASMDKDRLKNLLPERLGNVRFRPRPLMIILGRMEEVD